MTSSGSGRTVLNDNIFCCLPSQVPNSLPNRCNIEIEIYGMEGIPAEDIREHERQKTGNRSEDEEDDEPAYKKQKPLMEPQMAAGVHHHGGGGIGSGGGSGGGVSGAMVMPPNMMPPSMMNQFAAAAAAAAAGMPHMLHMPQYAHSMQQHMLQQQMMAGAPPRPLFPAAAAATSMPNVSMLQQPPKPTFPAYRYSNIAFYCCYIHHLRPYHRS